MEGNLGYRLGIDLGTHSIGWAALQLEGEAVSDLIDAGVRIFSDGRNPKDGSSLAVQRREPRSMRRNRDRKLARRQGLLKTLREHGLLPADPESSKVLEALDPWILRAKGLDHRLEAYELGRAIFHLQQRRGFKSNRKTDSRDNEGGAIAEATARTEQRLIAENCRTLGELFGRRRQQIQQDNASLKKGERYPQPGARVSPFKEQGNKIGYDYYPTRALIHHEFQALWNAQRVHHPDLLTRDAYEAVEAAIFFQRPLKPQIVGKCTFLHDEDRASRALPTLQRLRIFQEVNHLTYRLPGEAAQSLTLQQRDKVVAKLCSTSKVTFDSLRKSVLKLPPLARFNFETSRDHLKGDETAAKLTSAKRWGPDWRKLPLQAQDAIVQRLLEEEDEERLVEDLILAHGLSAETAQNVSQTPLPTAHAALSLQAAKQILPVLKDSVITFDKAVQEALGQSHAQLDSQEETLKQLPYYGAILQRHVMGGTQNPQDRSEKRYGKVANPTVHVALSQLRRVVNDTVQRYGPPDQIVVELARELPLSAKGKSELKSQQKKNEKANDERRALLAALNQDDTYNNRLRVRLWEELNPNDPLERRCPFTGEQISAERLFSDAFEIEHILPSSRTLDDSPANKTLAARHANRYKRDRSPFEAFGQSLDGFCWEDIAKRGALLPANKAWRFSVDAMDRYENEETDFAERQLRSTQYIARLAATYLVCLVGDPGRVYPIPGRMTSDLRHHWGLNSLLNTDGESGKNRNDHRHHAIDAIVVGLTDRALMQALARDARRERREGDARLIDRLSEPWPNFRKTVQDRLDQIVVSHKPDHGVQGALHNDTAYGLIGEPDKAGKRDVVHRVPVESLDKPEKLSMIRDPMIRNHLQSQTEGLNGKAFVSALVAAGEAMSPPVRRVRICEALTVIPISNGRDKAFKAYKGDGNYCYDIWMGPKGKWVGEVVSRFDAHKKGFDPNASTTRAGAPLLLRLRGGDMISIERDGAAEIMRVVKMTKGSICLARHTEGGALKARDADASDPFNYLIASPSRLQKLKAVQLRITPSGQVFRDRRYGRPG